ncbi:hypothetical protein EVG20_g9107 [Dentipellis fragilis]|uniref:Uncharacterized protein n=1 Tax=Dentipellis fragilis TaxID=205917 RepID=A0A4Y9Y0I2_9AGAM|nr:hypothetical protein EVG20_g9107 [Dentipellis fragilis]
MSSQPTTELPELISPDVRLTPLELLLPGAGRQRRQVTLPLEMVEKLNEVVTSFPDIGEKDYGGAEDAAEQYDKEYASVQERWQFLPEWLRPTTYEQSNEMLSIVTTESQENTLRLKALKMLSPVVPNDPESKRELVQQVLNLMRQLMRQMADELLNTGTLLQDQRLIQGTIWVYCTFEERVEELKQGWIQRKTQ